MLNLRRVFSYIGTNCETESSKFKGKIRESRDRLTLHLINLRGNNAMWNEGKREPVLAAGISAAICLDRPVRGIYCASPDSECLAAQKLPYTAEQTENGCIYTVKLPDVRCWTAVWVQLEE